MSRRHQASGEMHLLVRMHVVNSQGSEAAARRFELRLFIHVKLESRKSEAQDEGRKEGRWNDYREQGQGKQPTLEQR